MTDIFIERNLEPALSPPEVTARLADAQGCLDMHRVAWHGSLLSADGCQMICWFRAPDMESARIAMRQLNVDMGVHWRGSVHDAPGLEAKDLGRANVLVTRRFEDEVTLQQIQDIEDAGSWCLETRNVRFIRTYFAADRKRMICLYEAPDAESVRQAQREAGVPFEEAWSFAAVGPAQSDSSSN